MDLAFVGLRLLWCLRCRTHHPCLDSHATLWKNVNSCNLAIWSVRSVFVHLSFNKYKFTLDIFQDSTSTSNQSGWINWLGWKRLRFRWQHPDSRGKLDAVTWIPKRSLKILRRPILPKCSKVILQTSHQSCHFPPPPRSRPHLHLLQASPWPETERWDNLSRKKHPLYQRLL